MANHYHAVFVLTIAVIGMVGAAVVPRSLLPTGDTNVPMNLTADIVLRDGYYLEQHQVTTADGYILTMFRIPGSPANPVRQGKNVAFLMHGLLSSSADYVISGGCVGCARAALAPVELDRTVPCVGSAMEPSGLCLGHRREHVPVRASD